MHATKDQQSSLTQIKKRAEFLKIQGKGRKWVSHGLILQTAPNEAGEKRIGFTVSKRVDKSAVRRNRIKRRLRAAAADVLDRKSTRLNSSHLTGSRMPSSA